MISLLATSFCFIPETTSDHYPKITEYTYTSQSNYLPFNGLISYDFDSLIIPIKRAGRLLMVEATVDGETGNLIFDTGANGIVLNRTYFRNHVVANQISSNGITGAVGDVDEIMVDILSISDITFSKSKANLADLGHIENRRGVKVLGLFGFALLKDFEIQIDIMNGLLKLYRLDKKGNLINTDNQFKPDFTEKMDVLNNIVFIKASIGSKSLRFCFDTGAETNAINSDAPNAVLKTVTIQRKSSLRGAGSQVNQVLFGTMNNFELGDRKLLNMETIITNLDHLTEAYGTHIDGMLGFNFLTKGIICINFGKKQFGIHFNNKGDL